MHLRSLTRRSRLLALSCLSVAALGGSASATWSIVLTDTATGEVAIGCATCLENFDLEIYVPVMRVGLGGGCSQSQIDSSGQIRKAIWDGLEAGDSPQDILNAIKGFDTSYQSRQIGIVDLQARGKSFTGNKCGSWAGGVKGKVGTITYAIQGNVLAGSPVLAQAEQAILNPSGDLAERLMEAMKAAASMGGDGRCSCDPVNPDSCGAPPPGFQLGIDKAADCGFMLDGRFGDVDGDCTATDGCSNGTYYLNLNVANQTASDPDPVVQLHKLFDTWKLGLKGRPDHILSTKSLTLDHVPGNGTATTQLDITAIDREGVPLGVGGATVTIVHAPGSAGLATFGTPVDHGDGTYSIPITAGVGQGTDVFQVALNDGVVTATLYPYPTLEETDTLTADASSISATAGGTVNFGLSGPALATPPSYYLFASASGTTPGFPFGKVTVPLNFDAVLVYSFLLRNGANFVNTDNALFADGTQAAQFVAQPNELSPLVGFDLSFAYFTHNPGLFASNPIAVTVLN
jgi:uncharacterized Ntn-hydrolase superfamily protein